jgi:hypothetical protein
MHGNCQLHDANKKKEPEVITTEKQNSSFLKYTTCTHDDGQLGHYKKKQKGEHEPKLHTDSKSET